jgi:hypothetical protein
MPLNERNAQGVVPNAQISRSDHTMVMDGQANTLFIFGGLFTDVRQNSIYVYRDWLRVALNAVRSAPSLGAACKCSSRRPHPFPTGALESEPGHTARMGSRLAL